MYSCIEVWLFAKTKARKGEISSLLSFGNIYIYIFNSKSVMTLKLLVWASLILHFSERIQVMLSVIHSEGAEN